MTPQSMATRYCALRFWNVLSLLVLVTAVASKLAGQNGTTSAANQSAFEAHFAAAQQAQRDRDYPKAALRAEPNRPDTWLWLATAQEISGQLQAEVVTLRKALKLQPKDIDLLYLLGSTYERLGKQEVAHLEKVAPGSSRGEQLLAESYATSNEWPSAVIHFQSALAASPNRAGLHVELGEVLLRAGKVNQATREFDEELRLDPRNL